MRYQKTQFSMPLLIIVGIITGFVWLAYLYQFGNNPASLNGTITISIIMLLIFLLFFRLTITVDDSFLKVVFGIGLIRFSFKISDIKRAEPDTVPWYYGLGIRFTTKGTLYNVQGRKVLKIGVSKGKTVKTVLIGTAEPEVLMGVLGV